MRSEIAQPCFDPGLQRAEDQQIERTLQEVEFHCCRMPTTIEWAHAGGLSSLM